MPTSLLSELSQVVSLERVLVSMVLLALTWLLLRLLSRFSAFLSNRFPKLRLVISTAHPIIRLFCWIACIALIIFVVFRPPLNALLAVSASVGLAVGLGAQDLIRNLIAGVLILFERPFLVGDMIEVDGHYGEVHDISLRSTKLKTFDDSLVILPNALVFSQSISNSNSGVLDEMVVIEFKVPAALDPIIVRDLAYESAFASPYVFLRKPIKVMVEDFYDKAHLTRIQIKAYVTDVRDERVMASDITLRVKRQLLNRGLLGANSGAPVTRVEN
jgi:small-conductance mechanosensitive channel